MNELAIKMAIETTTSCQLVQNFLVCAVETSRLHKLKSFGLIGRHSKLYCLCIGDIQNFIVCAVATFKTLLFVQWRHSKLYCLCNRDIQNFIVCAVETFKTLLFVQSSHLKLFSLCVPSGAPYYNVQTTFKILSTMNCTIWYNLVASLEFVILFPG